MKTFIALACWLILFVISWPLAILALILFPVVWLLTLPFRLVGMTVCASLALIKTILFLPARLLGYRSTTRSGERCLAQAS